MMVADSPYRWPSPPARRLNEAARAARACMNPDDPQIVVMWAHEFERAQKDAAVDAVFRTLVRIAVVAAIAAVGWFSAVLQ